MVAVVVVVVVVCVFRQYWCGADGTGADGSRSGMKKGGGRRKENLEGSPELIFSRERQDTCTSHATTIQASQGARVSSQSRATGSSASRKREWLGRVELAPRTVPAGKRCDRRS